MSRYDQPFDDSSLHQHLCEMRCDYCGREMPAIVGAKHPILCDSCFLDATRTQERKAAEERRTA